MGVIVVIVIPVALSVSRKDASGSGLLVTGYWLLEQYFHIYSGLDSA